MPKKPTAKKKQPDTTKRIQELEKENRELHEQCGKLRQQNLRLSSLRTLWKKSALRYQKIAAALSHAYYTSHVLYGDEYGEDVIKSHSEIHLAS